MASTGIIQRRYAKHELISNPPLIGEIVFAIDTEEFGTIINGEIAWKSFDDLVKSVNGKKGNVTITKEELRLGNIDNTSDVDKPLSNAMIDYHNAHLADTNPHNITKSLINLENVDNTSDSDKPVSDATNIKLLKKLDILSTAKDSERLGGLLPEYYVKGGEVYTKAEADNLYDQKVYLNDVYTKIILDNMMNNKVNINDVYNKNYVDENLEHITSKGVPSGYAELGLDGKVPESQLPSSVTGDSVQIVSKLPEVGETDTIYVTESNNNMFIYDTLNSVYNNVSAALGETKTTAYRGDLGKKAYDHIELTNNPHEVTTKQLNVYNIPEVDTKIGVINDTLENHSDNLTNHINNLLNPHEVTVEQLNVYDIPAVDTKIDAEISTVNETITNHSENLANPHNVTAEQVNAYSKSQSELIKTDVLNNINDHKNDHNNPHNITPSQIGAYSTDEVSELINASSEFYSRSKPTEIEVGGVLKGSTFNHITIQEVLDRLFYIYSRPVVTEFDFDDIPETIEYDEVIAAGDYDVSLEISNLNHLKPNSISFVHGTDILAENLEYSDSYTITIPEDITSTTEKTERFEIRAVNTHDDQIIEYYDIQWITPYNSLTVVNDDNASTLENTAVDVDVLENDTDDDSDNSAVASVTQGTNGTVSINSDGTIKYTPNTDFNGVDSFTYTNEQGTVGTVTVTVNAV